MHLGHAETAGVKMCVSNTGLHRQIASLMPPGAAGVSACEDDGDQGFCTCSKCRAWDVEAAGQGPDSPCTHAPGWPKHVGTCTGACLLSSEMHVRFKLTSLSAGQYSDRYARFWTAVAAEVAKHDPDAWVTGYACKCSGSIRV